MTSTKPYLLRAFYEWILDNSLTPYIVVNANVSGVRVPEKYVEEGKIVLNISPTAVQKLSLDNDVVEFYARFSGVSMHIVAPPRSIMAVYAKENGRGMVFTDEEEEDFGSNGAMQSAGSSESDADKPKRGKPHLKIVK